MTRNSIALDIVARKIKPDMRAVVAESYLDGGPGEALKGKYCTGCSLCCWALSIHHVPLVSISGNPLGKVALKLGGTECAFDTANRCKLHDTGKMPAECSGYLCAYATIEAGLPVFWLMQGKIVLFPWRTHQPEVFRELLTKLDYSGIIPTIPLFIPVDMAKLLIQSTHVCLGQQANFIMLINMDSKGASPLAEECWMNVIKNQNPMSVAGSINSLDIRIIKRELSRPDVIEKIKKALEHGIPAEDARTIMGSHERYDILLTPEEQQQILTARNAA